MKTNLITSTLAALALAATFQTAALADDPINPVQGAVCNLYWLNVSDSSESKAYIDFTMDLHRQPAAATFVDTAAEFKNVGKVNNLKSNVGMWTGWLKIERAGTYTFTCKRGQNYSRHRYTIWVNGQKYLAAAMGQSSFNVDLDAGFNSIKVIVSSSDTESYPLSITYKRAGSVKDPVSFGPADMWYDDEE